MKTFALSSKIFYKNGFLVIAYGLFYGILNLNFIRIFQGTSNYGQTAFVFLSETLKTSIFCTIFFMFLAYELFAKIKASGMDECLAATKAGRSKLLLNQLLLVVMLILIIGVTAVIYNLLYPTMDINNGDYVWHMLSSIFVYLFLVPVLGAFIGFCASLAFKRLSAYLLMITFILFSSPLAGVMAYTVTDATMYKVNITPIFDIFNIYPLNLDFSPIYNFGISLLPYKLEAIFFWFFAAGAIILFQMPKSAHGISRIAAICSVVACLANFMAFMQPSSRVDMSYRVDGTLLSDHAYYYQLYGQDYPEEKSANFQVTNYDLDLTIKNKLYAVTKIKVDNPDLASYPFTLYHNFKIQKITDQNGKLLKFVQEDDRVEVYSSEQPLSEMCFTYSGYNTRFYSNTQGIFLPGYFAYYPIAGHRNVYSPDLQYYSKMLLSTDTDFHLEVNANNQVFTNLSQNSDGTYSGKTNGLTIMSGFLKSKTVKGVEIIYPYFNTQEYSEERLERDVDEFIRVKGEDIVKKIFIVPGVNQRSDSIVAFSDYVTAEQLMALPDRYIYTKMLDFKPALYICQNKYLYDREGFNESLESEKTHSLDGICTLMQEKIDLLGETAVMEQINTYIFDNEDTRLVMEFLSQLGESV